MEKKIILMLGVVLLMTSFSSAIYADYFYHPQCGHCQQIQPFIQNLFSNYNINIFDTSRGSYKVDGTPTLKIYPDDGREVVLSGSNDIPKYSICELNEQSTKECMTTSYLNCTTNSYFVR